MVFEMKKVIIYIVFIFFLGIPTLLFSQEEITSSIKVLSRNNGTYVNLRWAPNTASAWLKLNKSGYEIERITIKKNRKLMPPSYEKKILATIKPKPLEEWETIADKNDYALMIAQLLYGKSTITTATNPIANILALKKDIDQKYGYVVLAADMNFEAATMAGLGYTDTDVEQNTVYLYRIKSLVPKSEIETGLKLVDLEKKDRLPAPIDLIALPEDKKITLAWDGEIFKSIFTAYHIEKSEDSIHFKRTGGDIPFINFNQEGSSNKQMIYNDSIVENYKPYYYRVVGVSAFGEKSPPSKIISAIGIKKLTATPKIVSHIVESPDAVILNWEFDKEAEKQIKEYTIDWAPKDEGPYTRIKTAIPVQNRSTKIKKVEASNYYKINAIGKSHQKTTSLRHFVQPVDSIPPNPPIGLIGTIDSLGIVQLSWQANIEKDIQGYIVYKANLDNEAVIPATTELITGHTFTDTVEIKSLNSKVYYQLVALDKRYNISDRSEKIELTKPDIIPPIPPIFKDYKVTDKGVSLYWINSSSHDVAVHQLYRKNLSKEKNTWQQLFMTDTITQYTDNTVVSGVQYKYAIFAEDNAKLQSEPSTPLTITARMSHSTTKVIKGFNAIADREIKNITVSWRKMPDQVTEILVYRSKNEDQPMLWRQIPPSINKLVDTRINPDNTYTYTLKTIFGKGTISQAETVQVIY
ncbi:hypothetical protein GCM10007384_33280 [Aquimarina muelleri]|uniref:Fibronectin type-III domain-containing protein n=2 Tax=Aquimarina muelleri TaxID=279356 RepID=A0A918N4I0_9FLAO|nr:hypothetical protein GCM10007384_33280 [Aquimarina muelleri]